MISPFWRRTAAIATLLVATVAAVAAALLFRSGESDGDRPPVPVTTARLPTLPVPLDRDTPAVGVPGAVEPSAVVPAVQLCEGCLDERGVLDVAEGFLFYVMPDHLGIRAVPYSVEYPPDVPPEDTGLRPLLPPGLVDAPPRFSFGGGVPAPPAKEETWIVWIQTGWVPYERVEHHIESGDLPDVARSWPPVKEEREILVNARTGEILPTGITGHIRRVDHDTTNLFLPGVEEARKRAAAWFAAHRPPAAN